MENRFGVKDFVLFLLVAGVGVMVFLAMLQIDRQWRHVQQIRSEVGAIRSEINDQVRTELQDIRMQLAQGVAVAPPGDGAPAPGGNAVAVDTRGENDPFDRLRRARQKPNFAQGDWLVEAFSGQVAKLTPLLSGDLSASIVQDFVVESLAQRDPDTLEWTPLLARSWQISEDGLQITFQLREGVRFSDGAPLTADDVVFTYELVMNEQIAAPRHRAYLSRIKSVEKLSTYEVRFIYDEPYFQAFELAAGFSVMPSHFYGSYSPSDFNASVGLLMGSGPYRMESPTGWKPGRPIQLVRNERYWGVQPAFNQLRFREISNDVARLTSFRNGEHDTFAAQPEQYHELIQEKAILDRTQRFEYQNPVGGYRFVAWNQIRDGKPTHFADVRVRQALAMLVDRERLVKELMLGYATVATGPFNPQGIQANPNVKPWPFDPSRAQQLLTEAGFTRGRDGVLLGPDGRPFRFRLTYPSGSGNYDRMVLLLKDAYERAGIILEPDPLEWAVFTDRLNNKNFEAISLAWTSSIESDVYQMFHSSQATEGGDNFISHRSEALDAALEQARSTVQQDERIPHWHRAHELLHDEQPYMFLFFPKSLIFIDRRIENVELTKLGLNPRVEWFVPRDRQRWTR